MVLSRAGAHGARLGHGAAHPRAGRGAAMDNFLAEVSAGRWALPPLLLFLLLVLLLSCCGVALWEPLTAPRWWRWGPGCAAGWAGGSVGARRAVLSGSSGRGAGDRRAVPAENAGEGGPGGRWSLQLASWVPAASLCPARGAHQRRFAACSRQTPKVETWVLCCAKAAEFCTALF